MAYIFDNLESGNYSYFSRQRIKISFEDPTVQSRLSLNEVFVAEQEPGRTSIYTLEVDGKPLGKIVSSGLIVSTGSGSTAWIKSARRISYSHLYNLAEKMGWGTDKKSKEKVIDDFAEFIWNKYEFPVDYP